MKTNISRCEHSRRMGRACRIDGQGLTEYLIILAIVVVAGIGAASFFGDSIKANFLALGSELTAGDKVDMASETQASRAKAKRDVNTQTTLKNYRD